MPSAPAIKTVQPIMPIRLISVRDLCRMTSRRFQRVPNENFFHAFVFSMARFFIFFGAYGRSASAAVPRNMLFTERKPMSVSANKTAIITTTQKNGMCNFQYGRSIYVPIMPEGFIMIYAIP